MKVLAWNEMSNGWNELDVGWIDDNFQNINATSPKTQPTHKLANLSWDLCQPLMRKLPSLGSLRNDNI